MGPGRRQDAIPEGRDRPLPGRMLLRDQSVGAGLYPLTVFICRHGVPNSGRLLSTSDADGDKAAALRIGAVARFASGDGMADPGTGTPAEFRGRHSWAEVRGIGGPTDNQESYAAVLSIASIRRRPRIIKTRPGPPWVVCGPSAAVEESLLRPHMPDIAAVLTAALVHERACASTGSEDVPAVARLDVTPVFSPARLTRPWGRESREGRQERSPTGATRAGGRSGLQASTAGA